MVPCRFERVGISPWQTILNATQNLPIVLSFCLPDHNLSTPRDLEGMSKKRNHEGLYHPDSGRGELSTCRGEVRSASNQCGCDPANESE